MTPTMPFSGSVNEAIRHTEEHAEDFGLSQDDVEGYTARMQELQRRARTENWRVKVDPESRAVRMYDPRSNTFVMQNAKGGGVTAFKPTSGAAYWKSSSCPGNEIRYRDYENTEAVVRGPSAIIKQGEDVGASDEE